MRSVPKSQASETGVSAAPALSTLGTAGDSSGAQSPTPAAPATPGGPSESAPPLMLSNGLVPPRPRLIRSLPGAMVMPFDEYLARPELGRSTLDKIKKSPLNLRHYVEHGAVDTKVFLRGRVAHRLLLEPKQFWLETVVWKGGSKTTGEGSVKRWKAFQAEHADKDIIDEWQEKQYLDLEEVFKTHPMTRELLVGAATEATVFFDRDGVKCKARGDIVQGDTVIDLKTTTDLAEFERSIYKWGYHRQGEWYLDGFTRATGREFKTFLLVIVEIQDTKEKAEKSPVDVAIFKLGADVIEDGKEENDRNLGLYKRCLETGEWPGFAPTTPCIVSRPAWRTQQ